MKKGPIPLNTIRTERILIRPVKVADAAIMHAAMQASFSHLRRWMPWAQSLASLRDTEIYLAHGEQMWRTPAHDGLELPLQIMDAHDQIYYGATGIKPANLLIPSFEIGYWINQPYAGQGLITEAMNALTRFLFDVLDAKRVEINCEVKNTKSLNVAKRLNFDQEGILRNQRFDASGRELTDSVIFSCVNIKSLPPQPYRYG